MPTDTTQEAGEMIQTVNLPVTIPDLDLTSERWLLGERSASVVNGVDVVHAGRLRPDRGRSPLGVSIPAADRPATDAYTSHLESFHGRRYHDLIWLGVNQEVTGLDYDDTGHADGEHCIYLAAGAKFANYTFRPTDWFHIKAGGATNLGWWCQPVKKVSDDSVLVDRSIGSDTGAHNLGLDIVRYSGHYSPQYDADRTDVGITQIMKTPREYARTGPWPEEMVDATLELNADGRMYTGVTIATRIIEGRRSILNENDTIYWDDALVAVLADWDKVYCVYDLSSDKRGIWVCNGRKFWLLKNGTYTLYLDLGSDDYLGERWDCARIGRHLVMFVNEKYPPRTIHIGKEPETGTAGPETLAGLFAPKKPASLETEEEDDSNTNKSWWVKALGSGGSLSAGDYQVMVRAINLEENAASAFVHAYGTGTDNYAVTAVNTDALTVFNEDDDDDMAPPPLNPRWTHIEVWRTTADGSDFYLEDRIDVAKASVRHEVYTGGAQNRAVFVSETPDSNHYPCMMSDTDLEGQTEMTAADLLAGGPPPICRKVVSLDDVTLCFGKAHPDHVDPVVDAQMYCNIAMTDPDGNTFTASTQRLAMDVYAIFTNYTWQDGDRYEIIASDQGTIGIYEITERVDASHLTLDGPGHDLTNVHGYILRGHTIKWPYIEDDEDVWYSRVDEFAPESFPTRTLSLSNAGDTFKNAVNVGNYVAVIMSQGVHLLYWSSTTLTKDTVAECGEGTPWERSVIVLGHVVLWATPEGPKKMTVNNSADDRGHRGYIELLQVAQPLRTWFQEAFDAGEEIDAGVDAYAGCLRWRRAMTDGSYQTAQYSYRTDKWTLLDDDSGLAYARSECAPPEDTLQELLYSISETGNVFRVNDPSATHPYDGCTVQAVTDESYGAVHHTRIQKTGAFSADMLGDVVRFESSNVAVNDVARTITAASADAIEFASVPGLAIGDGFVIGATRFRLRYAPHHGSERTHVKTLDGVTVHAHPGERDAEGDLRVKVYRDYGDDALTQSESAIVPIFDAHDSERTSADRAIGVSGDGNALEIELECLDARTDFRIGLVQARVREFADTIADADSS